MMRILNETIKGMWITNEVLHGPGRHFNDVMETKLIHQFGAQSKFQQMMNDFFIARSVSSIHNDNVRSHWDEEKKILRQLVSFMMNFGAKIVTEKSKNERTKV